MDGDQAWTPSDVAACLTRAGSCPPTLAQCGYPRHYANLQRTMRTGQHHSGTCVANSCPSPMMRPSNGHGQTLDGFMNDIPTWTPVKATARNHSKTSTGATTTLAEAGARHQPKPGIRIHKDDDAARCPTRQYATTVHFTMWHACNCLSLAYKSRRQTPNRGHAQYITPTPPLALPFTILHFASIILTTRDLEDSPPLSPCL
jgi:hypothetical protein